MNELVRYSSSSTTNVTSEPLASYLSKNGVRVLKGATRRSPRSILRQILVAHSIDIARIDIRMPGDDLSLAGSLGHAQNRRPSKVSPNNTVAPKKYCTAFTFA